MTRKWRFQSPVVRELSFILFKAVVKTSAKSVQPKGRKSLVLPSVSAVLPRTTPAWTPCWARVA